MPMVSHLQDTYTDLLKHVAFMPATVTCDMQDMHSFVPKVVGISQDMQTGG